MATLKERTGMNRQVLILGISESISNIGNWITMMAVFALIVFRGGGGVLQSSGIMMTGLVPLLLASPIAGRLCDRYDRRTLMIASELLSAALVALLIFTTSLALIYPILALEATVGSIMSPARRSIVPTLVPSEQLPRVNAFFQQLTGTIKIGAPLLAGGLLALIDPHTAIVIDVVSFLASALLLSRLPRKGAALADTQPQAGRAGAGPAPKEVLGRSDSSGIPGRPGGHERPATAQQPFTGSIPRLILHSAGLRVIFLTAFLGILVVIGFDILTSVFVRDHLGAGEGLFGVLVGLVGIGSVGSSLVIFAGRRRTNPWGDVAGGILLLGMIPLSFALSLLAPVGMARIAIVAAGCLVGGAGNGVLNVQIATLLQLLSPPEVLGRTSGAYQSTAAAGQLLGVVATPLLVPGLLSMGGYFTIAFAALSMLALWVLYNLRTAHLAAPRAEGQGGGASAAPVEA